MPNPRTTRRCIRSFSAFELIVYWATPRAIEATADLCSVDRKDCRWMVERLLGGGVGQGRPYVTAYRVIEGHAELTGWVIPWVERRLVDSLQQLLFARELLVREKEGHPLDGDDPIRSRLPAATRELIYV